MLHKRIRDENEITREPTTERNRDCSSEMSARSESFLTPNQRTDERALEKEREHPFHRQRLSDHTAGILRKVCPIRSELKLHRNAGDDADGEIESEDLRPTPDRLIVFFFTGPQRAPFPVTDEHRQTHRELRKQVVVDDREPELQPVPKARIVKDRVHCRSLRGGLFRL